MKIYQREQVIKTIQSEINKIDYKIGLLKTERRKLEINKEILNGTITKTEKKTLGTEAEPQTTARTEESQ